MSGPPMWCKVLVLRMVNIWLDEKSVECLPLSIGRRHQRHSVFDVLELRIVLLACHSCCLVTVSSMTLKL